MAPPRNLPDDGIVHLYVRVAASSKKALANAADRRMVSMSAIVQELIDEHITPAGKRRPPKKG